MPPKRASKKSDAVPGTARWYAEHDFKTWRETSLRTILPGYGKSHKENKQRAWTMMLRRRELRQLKGPMTREEWDMNKASEAYDLYYLDSDLLWNEIPQHLQSETTMYELLTARDWNARRDPKMNGHTWTSHPDFEAKGDKKISGEYLQYGGGLYVARSPWPVKLEEKTHLYSWIVRGSAAQNSNDKHNDAIRVEVRTQSQDLGARLILEGFQPPPVLGVDDSEPKAGKKEASGPNLISKIKKDKARVDEAYWIDWALEKKVEFLLFHEQKFEIDGQEMWLELGFPSAQAGRAWPHGPSREEVEKEASEKKEKNRKKAKGKGKAKVEEESKADDEEEVEDEGKGKGKGKAKVEEENEDKGEWEDDGDDEDEEAETELEDGFGNQDEATDEQEDPAMELALQQQADDNNADRMEGVEIENRTEVEAEMPHEFVVDATKTSAEHLLSVSEIVNNETKVASEDDLENATNLPKSIDEPSENEDEDL